MNTNSLVRLVRTYIHVYTHTYMHTHMHTYIHTYIHIHTYMHTIQNLIDYLQFVSLMSQLSIAPPDIYYSFMKRFVIVVQ